MPTWCIECGKMMSSFVNARGDDYSKCEDCADDDEGGVWPRAAEYDPNKCPKCGSDLAAEERALFCQNLECGWSLDLDDDEAEESEADE